ncbi:MAG: hypothetical protein HRU09_11900, partial [Oligoflexales bacterium]|nr:hypothetical protein [Oligoflexales bacterium]
YHRLSKVALRSDENFSSALNLAIRHILNQFGMQLFVISGLVTTIPLLGGYLMSRFLFKHNLLATLGGVCGGMTSTPALGAIKAKTDSAIPVLSYASAYPIALIMMIVATQLILKLI